MNGVARFLHAPPPGPSVRNKSFPGGGASSGKQRQKEVLVTPPTTAEYAQQTD